jgi:hypothetical protein
MLPFFEIPIEPNSYEPGNLVSRLIDGLGYRYHWATDGLTIDNLEYRPCESAKTTFETLQHIYSLSETVLLVSKKKPNVRPYQSVKMDFDEMRKLTLMNLKNARANFLNINVNQIGEHKVVFQFPEKEAVFPFWNFLNGQIMDAIYHVGQVVLMRRASGNPMNSKVRVFYGRNV